MIALATPADLGAIEEIERHSFPTPWPRAVFEAELARPGSHLIVERRARGCGITGFCCSWIAFEDAQILAIATHPDHRRAGTGGRLLAHALGHAVAAGCTRATLEVRRSNAPAAALYERAGFRTVHVRARYYQDNQEDALVMVAELAAEPRRAPPGPPVTPRRR